MILKASFSKAERFEGSCNSICGNHYHGLDQYINIESGSVLYFERNIGEEIPKPIEYKAGDLVKIPANKEHSFFFKEDTVLYCFSNNHKTTETDFINDKCKICESFNLKRNIFDIYLCQNCGHCQKTNKNIKEIQNFNDENYYEKYAKEIVRLLNPKTYLEINGEHLNKLKEFNIKTSYEPEVTIIHGLDTFDILPDVDGDFVFEVPYLLSMLERKQLDMIDDSRLSYFSLTTLSKKFKIAGAKRVGDNIRVFITNKKLPEEYNIEPLLRYEEKLQLPPLGNPFVKFEKEINRIKGELLSKLERIKGTISPVGECKILYDYFELGKYLTNTDNPDYLLIMNRQISEKIISEHKEYEGQFITIWPKVKEFSNKGS